MPIIVGLLAAGVSLALDKYQERHRTASSNTEIDSHDQDTGFETGIISSDEDRRREEEAFHELQNYADFQKALSNKVLDELSRDHSLSGTYHPNSEASNKRVTGSLWYDPTQGARYITQGCLSCPIIISQRPLGSEGPGWVRTYLPALMDCGISQQPFLKFLDSFNESLRFAPQVEAVNIAALEAGIGWRDETTKLATAIPNAVRVARAARAGREAITFLDHANISFFSPRGLFAMIIISTPDNLSPVINIKMFESSTSDNINMQGLNFGELDQAPTSSSYTQVNQPQSRRPNKLQKINSFISDYSDRRANPSTHTQPDLPLFSLLSSIANSHENKKDSRRRRNHRFQPTARRPSGSCGVGSFEGAFAGTKVGKLSGSVRGIMERMRRADREDIGQERDIRDVEIQPGALYLVIVNDTANDQNIADDSEIHDEGTLNIDPTLFKGKGNESHWFGQDDSENSVLERNNVEQEHFDEDVGEADELPPRYNSVHPQHRASVKAWREGNPESETTE